MIFLMMILSTVTGGLKITKSTTKTTIERFEKGSWLNGRLAHTYFPQRQLAGMVPKT